MSNLFHRLARSRAVSPACKGKEQRCKVIIMCIRQRTCSANYHILQSKRPWVLEIHRSKNGGGRLHGKAICTYIRIHVYTRTTRLSKNGGGRLHGKGICMYIHIHVYTRTTGLPKIGGGHLHWRRALPWEITVLTCHPYRPVQIHVASLIHRFLPTNWSKAWDVIM